MPFHGLGTIRYCNEQYTRILVVGPLVYPRYSRSYPRFESSVLEDVNVQPRTPQPLTNVSSGTFAALLMNT